MAKIDFSQKPKFSSKGPPNSENWVLMFQICFFMILITNATKSSKIGRKKLNFRCPGLGGVKRKIEFFHSFLSLNFC